MKKNMGTADKAIRSIIALIFLGMFFTHIISGTLALIFIVLSVIFVLTSLVSFCPLYLPFGINTCQKK